MNFRQPSQTIWQATRMRFGNVAGGLTFNDGEHAPVEEEWNAQGWFEVEETSCGNRRHMTRPSDGPITELSLTFHTPESWPVPLHHKAILTPRGSTVQPRTLDDYATL